MSILFDPSTSRAHDIKTTGEWKSTWVGEEGGMIGCTGAMYPSMGWCAGFDEK